MKLIPVASSNIYATAHGGDTIHVRFLSGETYAYAPTTAADHDKLRSAHSIGAALNVLKKSITGTKVPSTPLAWDGDDDVNGNTIWTAPSPLHDEAATLLWRLAPRLADNEIEWYECHDLELMDKAGPRGWPTIGCAKAGVADRHAEILGKEGIQDVPQPAREKSPCETCAPDDGPCELQRHNIVAAGGTCNRYKEIEPL